MKTTRLFLCTLSFLAALPDQGAAEDNYYHLPLSELKISLPPDNALSQPGQRWQLLPALYPYAVLDGEGEVYVSGETWSPWGMNEFARTASLAIRAPKGKPVTGRIFLIKPGWNGMAAQKFEVPASQAKEEARKSFFETKREHYERLWNRNIPGGAWFRHQVRETGRHLGITDSSTDPNAEFRGNRFDPADTYDLFTGNRALSENLQLDRVMPETTDGDETVAITNLTGITIAEMNWKELIRNEQPQLDPLAAAIPADQHAVFFPSFEAMTQLIDEADANGTPVLQLLEPRAEDADARGRYQKQLCLGLTEVSRLLGPQVIASVAFTGSDPFLRVGTDVAVLFEARNVDALKTFLEARQKAGQTANPIARAVRGEMEGVGYTAVTTPDRSVSSYLAAVSNTVIVCNSPKQLENILRAVKGKTLPLKSLDEYVFFRTRYVRSAQESAFVVLSDATIRRWCSPQWRIMDSRRTRAAAVMAELQASQVGPLAAGTAGDAVLKPPFPLRDAGEFKLTRDGVVSTVYGSLNFMTPIAELPLTQVTKAEAAGYNQWRDNYQRNWRQFFDPIAIRFSVTSNQVTAELTVMPLIQATDYREFISLGSGAEISPTAGDPHNDSLFHLLFAVNTESRSVREAGSFVGRMAPGLQANPFGWLGQAIAVYADTDPFWERMSQGEEDADDFLEKNYRDLPMALHFEVRNPLALAVFLTGLRGFVDQTAPRLTTWENLEHASQPYVKIRAPSPVGERDPREWALYYAATPKALIVTLSEPLLKRAIDRQAARMAPISTNAAPVTPASWLGKSLAFSAERTFFQTVQKLTRQGYDSRCQLAAWNSLPILNEWKRLYPGKDPVKVHEQLWGTKLVCPGGGAYVWNEKWQTMESTVFGHPGEPKKGSGKSLLDLVSARAGVTFETNGLSAKAVLNRKSM